MAKGCLGYCLNLYPTITWEDLLLNFTERPRSILKILDQARQLLGVGLWFPASLVDRIGNEIDSLLSQMSVYPFTLNGFPYDHFHTDRVKEQVYLPDWSSLDRLIYTQKLANWLAKWGKKGSSSYLSISTVPIGYQRWWNRDKDQSCLNYLSQLVQFLEELERQTESRVVVAFEPEPDCVLEDLASIKDFCDTVIIRKLVPLLGTYNRVRRYLGICLDTVHCCVVNEDPQDTLSVLNSLDIPVYKLQIGTALIANVQDEEKIISYLASYAKNPYLHQTRIWRKGDDQPLKFSDLPQALQSRENKIGVWRVHYHVPLMWKGIDGILSCSIDSLTPTLFQTAYRVGVEHFEIETYTLNWFLENSCKMEELIAQEIKWVEATAGLSATYGKENKVK